MAGDLVPLVLFPRYSTFAGAGDNTTIAMDVTEYQSAIVNVWRRAMLGSGTTFQVTLQESTDQDNWTDCTGGGAFDPGAGQEVQATATLKKRWFRLKLALAGASAVVTCWAVGALEQRTN
jgi:hypothetical protein